MDAGSSYLVAETLGGNDGDLIADTLVGLKVEGELGVVALNDDLGGPLNGLSTDATHFGGCWLDGCSVTRNQSEADFDSIQGVSLIPVRVHALIQP